MIELIVFFVVYGVSVARAWWYLKASYSDYGQWWCLNFCVSDFLMCVTPIVNSVFCIFTFFYFTL